MKILMPKLWKVVQATDTLTKKTEELTRGPKAFCSGTILPCTAGKRCRHFGIHFCSTYKKHKKTPCPHYAEKHDFTCSRVD